MAAADLDGDGCINLEEFEEMSLWLGLAGDDELRDVQVLRHRWRPQDLGEGAALGVRFHRGGRVHHKHLPSDDRRRRHRQRQHRFLPRFPSDDDEANADMKHLYTLCADQCGATPLWPSMPLSPPNPAAAHCHPSSGHWGQAHHATNAIAGPVGRGQNLAADEGGGGGFWLFFFHYIWVVLMMGRPRLELGTGTYSYRGLRKTFPLY